MKAKRYRSGRDGYVSEFEQFIEKFLEEHPATLESQHKGWNIFWDHEVDFDGLKKAEEDSVPAKSYYYS